MKILTRMSGKSRVLHNAFLMGRRFGKPWITWHSFWYGALSTLTLTPKYLTPFLLKALGWRFTC